MAMMSFHKEDTSSEEEQTETNNLYSTDMVGHNMTE